MQLGIGDRRALANRIAQRLTRDGKIANSSIYDVEGIAQLTNTIAEEVDEYFGPVESGS